MPLVDKLRNLYLLDQQIRGLRVRLDSALARQAAMEKRLAQAQQQLRELQDQHKHAKARVMTLELQVKEADDRITKLREQMNNVRTNKEYSALLIEVNTLKLEKTKVDDQTLAEMTKTEEIEKQVKEVETKILEHQKLLAQAQTEVQNSRAEVGDRLDALTQQRKSAEADVPSDSLTIFNKLAITHEGDTMAPVSEESRRHKEYSCGGCYIGIPVERVNALLVRDEVVCCPSCGRILFLEQELKESMSDRS